MLPRISACLDRVIGESRPRARIMSHSNFPIAAGLASSASAFAATTVAAASAADLSYSTEELARLAGRASGSAARSLYGGFVELRNSADTIDLTELCKVDSWPLQVVVAITETGPKPTGSTAAMEISRETSAQLAEVAEHNCLKMHSVMWASRPPMVYWNSATMRCMQTMRQLQAEGCQVFFTIDAGPQVKAVCLPEDAEVVRKALSETPGVQEIMVSGLGPAARLVGKT